MTQAATRPTGAGAGAVLERGLDTSNGLDFVRERLALVAKTLFLVSFVFYLFLLASMVLVGGAPFAAVVKGPVAVGHLAASWTMGLLWILASRARFSRWSLGTLDAIGIVVACAFLSIMTWNDEGQILQVLLALTVTVMIRAILVPSRPRRTVVLSLLAFLPTVVVCIMRHHPTAILPGFTPEYQKQYMTLNTILWSVLGTTLATITSRVTYGLRKQVAEANELGQYVLEEKIGGGGMGEVWRARHRLLIRPAAIKLIRPRDVRRSRPAPQALRARSPRYRRAQVAAHGAALRLRRYRGRQAVLRDGAARRPGSRYPGPPVRAAARGARRPHPAPGLLLAPGRARQRTGSSRHQACKRCGQSRGNHLRFRQGARLRSGQTRYRAESRE